MNRDDPPCAEQRRDLLQRAPADALAAIAAEGNNLIVDDVMLENEREEYATLLFGFEVFFVGVFAPLDVLEARERQRGDRLIGLARLAIRPGSPRQKI